jgi:hypothetical protein
MSIGKPQTSLRARLHMVRLPHHPLAATYDLHRATPDCTTRPRPNAGCTSDPDITLTMPLEPAPKLVFTQR